MTASSHHKLLPGRILLVDDEPVFLHALAAALRGEGYDVETAEDGEKGLCKYRAKPWGVVVTDRAMPKLDGEEMAAAIRAINPEAPIILITGLACAQTTTGIFNAILAKPFRSRDLLDLIASASSIAPAKAA
jgi:two-component system, NtrC family, nitrogen regulation response regulator NtrX